MASEIRVEQALVIATQKMDDADIYCGHGTDNTWDEACLLLLHALGLERADESILQQQLSLESRQTFEALIAERINKRVPAAYLIGEAEFAGLRFMVDERVLVPRSPFAELILKEFSPWVSRKPSRILDLCTGSGCIGIASAMAFPEAQVMLSDLSMDALDIAKQNIIRHGLTERCQAIQSDIFSELKGQRFDLIVSNPPYVDKQDINDMPEEYHQEPAMGLAAGNDGLDIVRPLLNQAAEHLNKGGYLMVEVGNSWVALEAAYPQVPFTWVEFEYGGHGVFILTKNELVQYQKNFHLGLNVYDKE